jgi:NAD(P) transhydrogenase subunit alpha
MQHRVGVLRESAATERRASLPPGLIGKVRALGLAVAVERGAGERAWFSDSAYREAGAAVLTAEEIVDGCDTLLCVGPPAVSRLRPGRLLIGLLDPLRNTDLVAVCAARGVTAVSLDLLPRTLSRAQPMDALTSQAAIAGYKAAVLAADTYGGYFPMLVTAAGTVRPATVLVLGTGVAGLAAIGTARRIGAVVTGYDIRPEAADEVRSLGAHFLDFGPAPDGGGTGGYARALSGGERAAQQAVLQERVAGFDIVITTARVPGRTPPVLVTAGAVKGMRPGSVVIDLAAGADGGNVEGSVPDTSIIVGDGVTVIGAGNLPSAMAPAATAAYGRNMLAVLTHLVRDGAPVIDRSDEIQAAIVVDGAATTERKITA